MNELVLIAHNLRSCHNVGSLLRTAEGLGVTKVYFTGYTPYPSARDDNRMPHLRAKINKQIQKTALGAEASQDWQHVDNVQWLLDHLKDDGFTLAAIEQAPHALPLPAYAPASKLALLVGREVEGVEQEIIARMNIVLEIPMFGRKESFNVVQAAAMGLYHCRFMPFKA